MFLKSLNERDCLYFGLHPSNLVGLYGNLASEKNSMLQQIREERDAYSKEELDSIPSRFGEGAVAR